MCLAPPYLAKGQAICGCHAQEAPPCREAILAKSQKPLASNGAQAGCLCSQVQMETPDHWKATALEENCMTPRRVLDKENSDDFSSFAGLQEGPGTAALFRHALSLRYCPAS